MVDFKGNKVIIYFSGIRYKHKAILWAYDPETDSAQCQLKVLEPNEGVEYLKDRISRKLEHADYGFIKFNRGEVTVADVSKIADQYAMVPVPELNQPKPKISPLGRKTLQKAKSTSPTTTPASSPPSSPSRIRRIQRTVSAMSVFTGMNRSQSQPEMAVIPVTHKSKESTGAEDETETTLLSQKKEGKKRSGRIAKTLFNNYMEEQNLQSEQRLDYQDIQLERLILKDLDVDKWRQTLACKKTFQMVTDQKHAESKTVDWLRTSLLVAKQHQLEKNKALYPKKAELANVLDQILAQLNTIYNQLQPEFGPTKREALYFFLQQAVVDAMTLSSFFETPTEIESWSEQKRSEVFQGNGAWYFQLNTAFKMLRCEAMLTKFLVLLNPSLPVEAFLAPVTDEEQKMMIHIYLNVLPSYRLMNSKSLKVEEENQLRYRQVLSYIIGINQLIEGDKQFAKVFELAMQSPSTRRLSLKAALSDETKQKVEKGHALLQRYVLFHAINQFKMAIPKQIKRGCLADIQLAKDIIIGMADTEQTFAQRNELTQGAFKSKQAVIDNYRSFHQVLTQFLEQILRPEEIEFASSLAQATTIHTIKALKQAQSKLQLEDAIPPMPMPGIDNDFYLCPKWVEGMTRELFQLDPNPLIKHPKNNKVQTLFFESISQAFVALYTQAIEDHKQGIRPAI